MRQLFNIIVIVNAPQITNNKVWLLFMQFSQTFFFIFKLMQNFFVNKEDAFAKMDNTIFTRFDIPRIHLSYMV